MVCGQNLRSSAELRACLAGLLIGSILGLPLRADDARLAAPADGRPTPAAAEVPSAASDASPAFRFTDDDGRPGQRRRPSGRKLLRIGDGNSASTARTAVTPAAKPAGFHFEDGAAAPRNGEGKFLLPIATRSTEPADASPPATSRFRFEDERPALLRRRSDAGHLTLTIDGAHSAPATAQNAEAVQGFSFAETTAARSAGAAPGSLNAKTLPGEPTPARHLPTVAPPATSNPPVLLGDRSASDQNGVLMTIRQRTNGSPRPTSRPPQRADEPAHHNSRLPQHAAQTRVPTQVASPATPAARPPRPAGIVQVSSFEPAPAEPSTTHRPVPAPQFNAPRNAATTSTPTTPDDAAWASAARSTRTVTDVDGDVSHARVAKAAADATHAAETPDPLPAWVEPAGTDLTAAAGDLSTVRKNEAVDWSPAEHAVETQQENWWVRSDSPTTANAAASDAPPVVADAPPVVSEEFDCATCAGIVASQFLLPVQIPAGAETDIALVPDVSDVDAIDRGEPDWPGSAPELLPLVSNSQSPFARAIKPAGAAAVPHDGDAYRMGPARPSHPLPMSSLADDGEASARQPRPQMPQNLPAEAISASSIELAALLQDLEPIGPGLPRSSDVSAPTAADFPATRSGESETSAPADASGPANAAGGMSAEQTLGEAPEESDEPLQFLRRQTVLLDPGEHQFDVGVSYLNDTSDFPVLLTDGTNLGVIRGQTRQRLLSVPLELRMGIAPYTQAFVNVPFGWSNSEVSFNGSEFTEDEGGIGDVSAGVTKQIIVGNQYYPDVLAGLGFSAPTGDSSLTTALGTPGSSLGQGFWTLTGSLSFIQTYDPLVFYYGLGYTFRFQNEFGDNIEIEPGDQVFYRFGAGFAVNPHVTLSAAFTGSVIGRDKVDGIEIGGSVREPMSIRLAATISRRKGSKTHSSFKLVEPYVNFGLNEDSVDTLVGISWTH